MSCLDNDFLNGSVRLMAGDCRQRVRELGPASLDGAVTDPPYALVSIVKRFGSATAKGAQGDVYARAASGFMGQQWDTGEVAFDPSFWADVRRAMKPGAHLVAFSGTRSYHRLACAIEDAGFEIRDQLAWVYGSGFPKSHDVSKGIDRMRRGDDAEERRQIILTVTKWIAAARDRAGLTNGEIDAAFGLSGMAGHWTSAKSQPAVPTADQWAKLLALLGVEAPPSDVRAAVDSWLQIKGQPAPAWFLRPVTGQYEKPNGVNEWAADLTGKKRTTAKARRDIPASPDAEEWQGWGTALKPGWEPIVLARVPLDGTVAQNVLKSGTGAINLDGCRIHADDALGGEYTVQRTAPGATQNATGQRKLVGQVYEVFQKPGRWPANILHDGSEEVVDAFPSDAGKSSARFFYSAKADAHDRIGSKHPTVKPVDLMQWLCRLICPPGGVILDPFAGSGTTGEAGWREGFKSILMEREETFQADIARRMTLATEGPATRKREIAKARGQSELALKGGLFEDIDGGEE